MVDNERLCYECCNKSKFLRYSVLNTSVNVLGLKVLVPRLDNFLCTNCGEIYEDLGNDKEFISGQELDNHLNIFYRLYEEQYNILTNEQIIYIFNKSGMSRYDFVNEYGIKEDNLSITITTIKKESSDRLRADFGDLL